MCAWPCASKCVKGDVEFGKESGMAIDWKIGKNHLQTVDEVQA
jgi:hypothetical protein